MQLLAFGMNHRSAAVEVREALVFSPDQVSEALHQAQDSVPFEEVALLSTCNRTEIYGIVAEQLTSDQVYESLLQWLAAYHNVNILSLIHI